MVIYPMDFVGYVPKRKVSDEWVGRNLSPISRLYALVWFMPMKDLGDPMSMRAP